MKLNITITLVEEMLGTKPASKEIFERFVASKAPDGDARREELDSPESVAEAGTTCFQRDEGDKPMMWNYQVKGFFKDACGCLRKADGTLSKQLKAHNTLIDGLLFVNPRRIHIEIPNGGKMGWCERPLRAQTMQGPRVALARSETVPVGSIIKFTLAALAKEFGKIGERVNSFEVVREWLTYGQLRGLGQWRNSGKGAFTFTAEESE